MVGGFEGMQHKFSVRLLEVREIGDEWCVVKRCQKSHKLFGFINIIEFF